MDNLILEKKEYLTLKRFLNLSVYSKEFNYIASIERLSRALSKATVLDEGAMPKDVVRFNSTVTLSYASGDLKEITLVVPAKSDTNQNRISILTPLGMALIGRSKGEKIKGTLMPEGLDMVIYHIVPSNETSYLHVNF